MTKRKGVWDLQQVRDHILESIWTQSTRQWAWGYGYSQTLGAFPTSANMKIQQANYPAPTGFADTNWTKLSQGNASRGSYGWVGDETTYAWGDQRNYGLLGLNEGSGNEEYPQAFPAGSGRYWSNITQSSATCMGVKDNGELWVWGNNDNGQLAQNSTTTDMYSSPVQIGTDTTWSKEFGGIACSNVNMWALKTDGSMWSWGSNSPWSPPLCDNGPADTKRSSPVQCVGGTNWREIAIGGMGAIQTDGTLWTWGVNYLGSLGLNRGLQQGGNPGGAFSSAKQVGTQTTWKKMIRGSQNTWATKTDGTLWVWGSNNKGSLGLNTAGNPAPYWGTQFSGSKSSPTQLPGEWANISQIGNSYGLYGLKGNGEIWAWGNSNPYYGYLLTGNINDGTARSSPVLVGGQNKWANTDDSFNNMYYGHIGLVNSIPADDL